MRDRTDRENPVHEKEAKTDRRRSDQKKTAEHEQPEHGRGVMIREPSAFRAVGRSFPGGHQAQAAYPGGAAEAAQSGPRGRCLKQRGSSSFTPVTHERQRVTKPVIPLLVLALSSITVGGCVLLLGLLLPQHVRPRSTIAAARDLGHAASEHRTLRRSLLVRLDPATATGLMLCAALAFIGASGILVGVLALLVREDSGLLSIDRSAAAWSHDHASSLVTSTLNLITDLGTTWTAVALALILGTIEYLRTRNPWVAPFLVVLLAGEGLLTVSVKDVVDRVRPTLNPAAHTLGPSFPSGHSATAAAFYAGAALLLGRHMRQTGRALRRSTRRRGRGRGCSQPRAARRPLAFRRDRRPRPRLVMVSRLRHRLRRHPAPLRRNRQDFAPNDSDPGPSRTRNRKQIPLIQSVAEILAPAVALGNSSAPTHSGPDLRRVVRACVVGL